MKAQALQLAQQDPVLRVVLVSLTFLSDVRH